MLWTTGERPDGEPFEEQPTRIGMQLWRDLPRPGDVESAVRSDLPRGLISRHQDSLSRYQSMVARRPSAKSVCFGAQPNSLRNRKGSMAYRRSWPARSTTGRNRRDRGPSTPAGSAAPRGCHVRPRRRSGSSPGLTVIENAADRVIVVVDMDPIPDVGSLGVQLRSAAGHKQLSVHPHAIARTAWRGLALPIPEETRTCHSSPRSLKR
jgi:hypothetical protein